MLIFNFFSGGAFCLYRVNGFTSRDTSKQHIESSFTVDQYGMGPDDEELNTCAFIAHLCRKPVAAQHT
eukprot:5993440-Amphidinium_carterae.1